MSRGGTDCYKNCTEIKKTDVDFPCYEAVQKDGNSSYLIVARYLKDAVDRKKLSLN